MNATNTRAANGINRVSKRKANRFRQAVARRRIQELRDDKLLRNWLTEVWDEPPLHIECDPGRNFH